MNLKIGPIRNASDPGDPEYDGIVVVMPKGGLREQFARTDGQRIGYGHATPEQAMAVQLVEGRLSRTNVQSRSKMDYWRPVEIVADEKPAAPPKRNWMAMWKLAVDRLLRRG